MTFFYNLNKKLDEIRATPEKTHGQLNERDEGKPGKNFAKISADAAKRYGSKEAGDRVAGAVRAKLAKQGKLEEEQMDEGMMDTMKSAAQKALDVLGHGSDEDMIRDLQRKAGVPVTGKVPTAATAKPAQPPQSANPTTAGQKPMAEADMEEGNKFTGNLMKARAAGKKQADLDGDGDMEPVREGAKPDYIDLDKDGNRKESMKKAAADKKAGKHKEEELDEGWDDMLKDVEKRREKKTGEVERGHKHDIKHTATGRIVTRRTDDQGISVGADDEEKPTGEKRGRGRPKKTDKAPERVTAKAYKHKGSRKMSNEEIEEAIAALEEAGYSVQERKLSSSEKEEREDIVKGMKKNKGDFEKRYGKRGEEVMYATATKLAKERGPGNPDRKKKEKTEETTVAGSVAPAAGGKAKKGDSIIGKGIYDSMNRELETMIAESMNVSVNMNRGEDGQARKSITVSAEGEAAEQLAQLLNLAGMSAQGDDHGCGCDTDPCSCESEELDENQPDWPTNQETTGEDDPEMRRWAGGLNGPKSTGQTVGAPFNRQNARQGAGNLINGIKEDADLGMKLYSEYKNYKAK